MDKLTSMKVFRQVVESGSFVGAADQLGISTPMVSKHVMAIEKRVQLKLLNRNSHRLSLTEPGKVYFERCKNILEDLKQAEEELESLRSAPSGLLRIAFCDRCVPGLGLARDLAEYRRRYPHVTLDLSFPHVDGGCAADRYDLAFRLADEAELPPDLVARPIRRVPYRLVASPAYLERRGVAKSAEDLKGHDIVTSGAAESLTLEGPQGTVQVQLKNALRCRTMADVAIAVASGVGIAMVPAALCSDPAFARVLRPVLSEFALKDSTLYLLYRSRKHLPLKARKLIDLVLESSASSGEQVPGAGASVIQYPKRKVSEEIIGKVEEAALDSLEPLGARSAERTGLRPAAATH
ncbi:MAG: LysR family transcriptional regulator [Gammaproteobacteria bacterium]|nr:LysR family transcriptional regulator [Gammaproteobacteria bacterium]